MATLKSLCRKAYRLVFGKKPRKKTSKKRNTNGYTNPRDYFTP